MERDHESEHLRHEIQDTRGRMSETLDELSVRLNPNRIKEQVKENIREATVGRVEHMARHASERVNETRLGLMDTIRDNPIPAAMIGVGIGWMLFNGRRSHTHPASTWSDTGRSGDYNRGYYGDLSATTPRLQQDDAGGIGSSISPIEEPGVMDRLRSKASDVGDTAGDVIDTARERVSDVSERVQNAASNVADTTRYQVRRLEDRFSDTLHENPLAIGAAAVAIGLVAGLAIPESRREHELMGGAREQLVERVRDRAEDVKDRVQNVAERVMDDAKVEARDEGLTS
jgi:ElaB/YqjD/DUF883 family membrane-anchored ribosome-binding protein